MRLFDYPRASRLMDEAGIDLILASTRPNVGYLSDYWHSLSDDYYVLWDTSVTHKTLAGIPKDESQGPFLVAGASESTSLERADPWIRERRYWGPGYYIHRWTRPDPDPGNPMDTAAEVLKEKRLDRSCIAVEMRYLGVSYFERLRTLLPQARFVDAESVLWSLRMLKSPEEIRRARVACDRTGRLWQRVMEASREGMTELEMERRFIQGAADEEISIERAYCIFGPSGLSLKNGSPVPSNNPLKRGQFIRVDVQGKHEGYICNLSRVIAFGDVTPEMERAQTLIKEMVLNLIPLYTAGRPVAEIRAAELKMYEGTGYFPVIPYTGHGVGRVVHEPPYVSQKDLTVLEPGMMVTVEPTVQYSAGGDIFVSLEDQLLVTEAAPEYLTSGASLELNVLSGV